MSVADEVKKSRSLTEETKNAFTELDDAYSTWTHRLLRFNRNETTVNSLFNALTTCIEPAVRSSLVFFLRLCLSHPMTERLFTKTHRGFCWCSGF